MTKQDLSAPGLLVLTRWKTLSRLPGGKFLFSRLLGRAAPYSGSISAQVRTLEPGRAEVVLKDRRQLRNHLRSVHALALANLGEIASGLAMLTALPAGTRGIVTRLSTDYLKKARGTIVATGSGPRIDVITEPSEHTATATLRDCDGETVAIVTAVWALNPAPTGPGSV